mgnify:CR=1 FL=1
MGALTLKPLAYKVRSWELTYTNYPNFFDNNFGLVNIQKRGNEIIRILPSRHDSYFWITNQTRFYFNKLNFQRLVFPFIKYKNTFIKVQWKRIVKFLQYLRTIQTISKKFLSFRRLLPLGLIHYSDNTFPYLDFLSNYFKNKFFNLNNTAISAQNLTPYIGNVAYNYLNNLTEAKINIFNQLNIVQDFSRIWATLKRSHLNYYIGSKKNLHISLFQIFSNSNIFFNKCQLLLLKDKIQIFTEEKLNSNFNQIILKNNVISEQYSSLWFDYKRNFGYLNKDNLYYHINCNNTISNNGIHFTFQSYGNMLSAKYNIFFPTSTLLEEKKLLLDGYGNLQTLNFLITRKEMSRSLLQYFWIFYLLFNISKRWNFRFIKQIKKFHIKNLNLLEKIILLSYGRVELGFKTRLALNNILFFKEKNIINTPTIITTIEKKNKY